MSLPTLNFPSATTDSPNCQHLLDLLHPPHVKSEPGEAAPHAGSSSTAGTDRSKALARFAQVVQWGAKRQGVKRRKVAAAECGGCSNTLSRPWACLGCDFVGCSPLPVASSSSSRCFPDHWAASHKDGGAGFAVDASSGSIFCHACDDLTYSGTFDAVFHHTRAHVEEKSDTSRDGSAANGGKGRGRGPYRSWDGGGPFDGGGSEAIAASCRGLRPLLNLSNTCFLSAVLQAFIHNPLLRAYFLSDRHNRHICAAASTTPRGLGIGKPFTGLDAGGEHGSSVARERGCMCCEMDRAFEECYGDDKTPFGPITMLYAMWHASSELEGYGQQDAHSFFLAALDQIHAHAKGQLSSCNCIAHQTYAGSLQSTLTCSNCRTTSTTVDPILDIQLDFPSHPPPDGRLTLQGMLRRFCAAEKVGEASKGYICSSCGGGKGITATKKLLVKKLPPVLAFQLKRFAHQATSTKIETPVRFPSQLSMRPYTKHTGPGDPLPESLFDYDLFAVVTHKGTLDKGHYWACVLDGTEWWHCDDDKISPIPLSSVLKENAYMLFYVKRSLAYAEPASRQSIVNGTGAAQPNGGVTMTKTASTSSSTSEEPLAGRAGGVNGHSGQSSSGEGGEAQSGRARANLGVGGGSGKVGHPIGGMRV